MSHFLEEMFHPRSIAVFGASGPMKMGSMQALSVIGSGFPGKVHYVHPTLSEVMGQKAYKSVSEIEGPVDLGLIVIPAAAVPGVLEDLGRKGTRHAVVTTAGFEEVATDKGRSLNRKMKDAARKHNIRFIGPNCLGLVNAHLPLNTTTFPADFEPGSVSIASHSGSYATQIFPYMEELEPGLGLRYVLSLGNEADVDLVDALDCFREDDKTKAVCLYMEGIRRGPEFLRSARATSLVKPVIAHYAGGNSAGARSGASHTAAMSMPEDLAQGLFRQCGIVPAEGIGELFDFARILSQSPPMTGSNVAVITNSGGPGTSAAYTLEKIGIKVPEFSPELKQKLAGMLQATSTFSNPVDFTFDTDLSRFRDVTKLVLESDEIDAVLVYGLFISGFFERRRDTYEKMFPDLEMGPVIKMLNALVRDVAMIPHRVNKPVVNASLMAQHEDGFRAFTDSSTPTYPTPERAAKAIGALAKYWQWRRSVEE